MFMRVLGFLALLIITLAFSTASSAQITLGSYDGGDYNVFNTVPQTGDGLTGDYDQPSPENMYSGNEISDEYCQYLVEENENLESRLNSSNQQIETLQNRLNNTKKEKNKLEKELESSKKKVEKLEREVGVQKNRIGELENRTITDMVVESFPKERMTAAFSQAASSITQSNP